MVKLRQASRARAGSAAGDRPILGHALLLRRGSGFLLGEAYFPRRKWGVDIT